MIYAIITKNNDVILFDSVTSFQESYKGSITSHPVENGSKISDHMINENVKLKLSGVVSDYNFYNPIKDMAGFIPAYNTDRNIGEITISSEGKIDTFQTKGTRQVDSNYTVVSSDGVFGVIASSYAIKQRLLAIRDNKEYVTIVCYEESHSGLKNGNITSFQNCLIPDIDFNVDPETGLAININLGIEQVKLAYVLLTQAKAQRIINQEIAAQVAAEASKGNQTGDTTKTLVEKKPEQHEWLMQKNQEKQQELIDIKVQNNAKDKLLNSLGG